MRPAMSVVSLLFLLLLLVETSQGIRLEEESLAAFDKLIHKESFMGGGDAVEGVSCRDGGLCSGRIRKLMMTKTMATSKTERSKERDIGHHSEIDKRKRREDFHVEPPETYPDILDIAGMDYSPAKRKPPIHN